MSRSRLSLAFEAGIAAVPDAGPIAVVNPPPDADLTGFGRNRVTVVHEFRPAFDLWRSRGFEVTPDIVGTFSAAIVAIPRFRIAARDLIARAAASCAGALIVDGQKTDGIDSILKDVRSRVAVGEVFSKAHGKTFTVTGGDFADWRSTPARNAAGFTTLPGVFSSDGPDPGSVLLAERLPRSLSGTVADLGAGWGYLSARILELSGVGELHLVEAQKSALDCARLNVTDARCRFHWADATAIADLPPLDAVVMNPPFHTGRKGDPSIGVAFVEAARRLLKPSGDLWLVANRHLPYERALAEAFLEVAPADGNSGYKILHARRPRRRRI